MLHVKGANRRPCSRWTSCSAPRLVRRWGMAIPPDARTVLPGHAVTYHGTAPVPRSIMGELATAAHASDNAMRLTIDVAPGDSPFGSWVSICHELGCTGNSSTPHGAVAGLAKAMNAIVQGILDMRGTPDAGLDVIREIATGYAEQRRESVPVRQPLAGVRQLVRPIAGTR